MKLSISIFLMLLSVLINNCQSSPNGHNYRLYESRLEAEEHCISTIFKTKTSLIFRTKELVFVHACKGNPEIYHKNYNNAKNGRLQEVKVSQ
ncbi:uncharacterized protein LOC122499890 isoform X2 [Leptopilina heterotoma]|uniref:uncharacterized protein LOC122499890 isoform X2 n=1 Tax=Leptopilina heterotoma TaxID=63436 RepID=UPI001CAA2F89|nr:uncharacterized protein LOC122499890 isoform X2 [Leptopilina heterotoma]